MSSPPTPGPQKGVSVDSEEIRHMNEASEARIRSNGYRQNRESSAPSSGRGGRHSRREASLGSGFEAITASAAANSNSGRGQNTSRRNAQSEGSRTQQHAPSAVPGLYQANAAALAKSARDQEVRHTSTQNGGSRTQQHTASAVPGLYQANAAPLANSARDQEMSRTGSQSRGGAQQKSQQTPAAPSSENTRMPRASESTMALSGLNPIELGQALNWGGPPMNPATYGMSAADFQPPAPGQQGKKVPIPAAGYYGKPSIGAMSGGTAGYQPLNYQTMGYQPLGSGNNVSPSRQASPTRQSQNAPVRQSQNSPTRQSHEDTYYDGKPMKYNAAGQAIPRGLTQFFHPPAPLQDTKTSTKPPPSHGKISTTGSQQYGDIKYHGNVDRNALISVDQGLYPMIPVTIDGVVHKAAVVDPVREIRRGGSRLDRSPDKHGLTGQGEQRR